MSLQSSPTTAKTNPSNLGADEHAPIFSLMRMESAAAERERDAVAYYERLQEERIRAVRESGMRALRIEVARKKKAEKRAAFLEKQLAEEYSKPRRAWLVAAVASFAFWGGVLWVVTR